MIDEFVHSTEGRSRLRLPALYARQVNGRKVICGDNEASVALLVSFHG